jgi:uncharacterized membrane-anchored protein YhcB (DUF1043 family)
MAWNWGISIITFAFGLGLGFAGAYLLLPRGQRARELEQQLQATQSELDAYRGKVSQHFQKTAELFEDMTDRYRAVYQHMAGSAQALCQERPPALQLEIVDRGRLAEPIASVRKASASVISGTDTEIDLDHALPGTADHSDDNDDDYLGDSPQVPVLDEAVNPPAGETSAATRVR